LFGAPRHARGLKTDVSIRTAPKTKNKDYYHFTPISGQGSALDKSECSGREALTSARKQGFEEVEKSDEVALYRLTARESSVLAA
jgi:hypothetical protein